MKEILVATNAVVASRTNSAVDWLVTMTGTPRITSEWNICFNICTASLELDPRINRSGQLKSSTAQPSVRNMGWETIVAFSPAAFRLASSAAAVPTATGVTMEQIGGLAARF